MKSKVDLLTDQEFKKIIEESISFKEVARKCGYTGGGCANDTIHRKCEELNLSLEHFTGTAKNSVRRNPENTFIENSTASQAVLRRMYTKGNYSEYKCSICGLEPVWNNKPLTMTLDHINGINNDHRLENLRWVCPNCDRQLDTFCSKNPNKKIYYNQQKNYCIDCGKEIYKDSIRCDECYKKTLRKVDRPSREELKNLVRNNSFCNLAKQFGVSDKSISKWCKYYNLPFRKKDINSYSDEEWGKNIKDYQEEQMSYKQSINK